MDRVFILYKTSLDDMNHVMRLVYAIKPSSLYLVRTQCDLHSQSDCRTIEQELAIDKEYAFKTLGAHVPILATSA